MYGESQRAFGNRRKMMDVLFTKPSSTNCTFIFRQCELLKVQGEVWMFTIKKAEHGRIDAFEMWCWRRLLRVPWTARRSNQSVLDQCGCFVERTNAEAETPILWPLARKN